MSANLSESGSSAAPPISGGDITGASGAGAASGGGAAANEPAQGEWGSFEEFTNAHENLPPDPATAAAAPAGAAQPAANLDPSKPATVPDPNAVAAKAAEGEPKVYADLPEDHPLLQEVRSLRDHRGTLETDLKTLRAAETTYKQQLARYQAFGGDARFEQMQPFFETAWNASANAWDYAKAAGALSGVHTPEAMGAALLDQIVAGKNPANAEYAARLLSGRDDITLARMRRLAEADKEGSIKLPEENDQWKTAEERTRDEETRTRERAITEREAAFQREQAERDEAARMERVGGLQKQVQDNYMNAVFNVAKEQGFVPKPDEQTKAPELYAHKKALTTLIMKAAMADLAAHQGFQRGMSLAESEAPSIDFVTLPDAQVFSSEWGLLLKSLQPLIAGDAMARVEAANKIASATGDLASASAQGGLPSGDSTSEYYGFTEAQWSKMSQDERDAAFVRFLDSRRKAAQISAGG